MAMMPDVIDGASRVQVSGDTQSSQTNFRRMRDSCVARSSDDFWPRDPASHTTHVAVNALNALWMAPLVQPDWDMFHSRHPAAALHAAARVVQYPFPCQAIAACLLSKQEVEDL